MKREWVGGRYTLPHDVRDGSVVYRSDVIFWLELPRNVLVGTTLIDPRKPVSFAQSLEDAMQRPVEGSPRRPSHIRVADDRLAAELRSAAAGIPIVVAPVPELDAAFADLAEHMAGNETEPSYLGGGEISPAIIEELFSAASLLFNTAPWRHMVDQQAVRVDIPHFGIDGAALSVIGNAGESFGLLLFSSIDDYLSFGNANAPRAARSDGGLALRSLSFDRKKEVPPSLLRAIEEHRWPVAGAKAYPTMICVGGEMDPRPVLEKDVRIMTAVTRAFLAYFVRHRDLFEAEDPEPVRESSEGDDGVTVTLTAPYTVFDQDSFKRPTPSMRAVGRNEPCPCGSGKKYKRCHLDADQAPRRPEEDEG